VTRAARAARAARNTRMPMVIRQHCYILRQHQLQQLRRSPLPPHSPPYTVPSSAMVWRTTLRKQGELTAPSATIDPDLYNQLQTTH
jgi:hypothetical protein